MKRKKQKGITLIEVIIVMAITGIIMAAVTMMFTSNTNILSKIDHNSELQLEAQQIQEQLSTVALECSGIDEKSNFQKHLILNDAININRTHHFEIQENYLVYQLIEQTENQSNKVILSKVLSKHIASFSITNQIQGIEYSIDLVAKSGKTVETLKLANRIIFRNYKE